MASRAPLVLAAALFVLGIAGLVQTVRQTSNVAAPTPLSDLALRPLVPTSTAPGSTAVPLEAVSDGPTVSEPTAQPTAAVLAIAAQEATPVPTKEPAPAPASFGGAFAAGVASDGGETVPALATSAPLNPLRFGMIGRDAAIETPTPAAAEESAHATAPEAAETAAAESTPQNAADADTAAPSATTTPTPTPTP